MASLRGVLLAFVALAMVAAVVNAANLIVGRRQAGDRLSCRGDVNIRAQNGQIVRASRICNLPRQSITQIQALDLGKQGRGGYAQISRGGVGLSNVTLDLWSQRSQPLNFTIQVYAKPYY